MTIKPHLSSILVILSILDPLSISGLAEESQRSCYFDLKLLSILLNKHRSLEQMYYKNLVMHTGAPYKVFFPTN